jgi:hypothetical protein
MEILVRLLNLDIKLIKKLLNSFAKMDDNNMVQIFILMAILLEKKDVVVNSDLLITTFFKALEIDRDYKNAFKTQNFKGYSIDEIGKIVEYMHATKITKTTRKQKVTDILRLHRQLVVKNMDLMSCTDLTALVNAVSKEKVSRSSVFNFVKKKKKENLI